MRIWHGYSWNMPELQQAAAGRQVPELLGQEHPDPGPSGPEDNSPYDPAPQWPPAAPGAEVVPKFGWEVVEDQGIHAWSSYDLWEAWRWWWVETCREATRGVHRWMLVLDVGGNVHLSCSSCPATTDDLMPDGAELIGGTILVNGQEVPIEDGMHPLDIPEEDEVLLVPVEAEVCSKVYRGFDWTEYDAWVTVWSWTPDNSLHR